MIADDRQQPAAADDRQQPAAADDRQQPAAAADIKTLSYARCTVHGLQQREQRYPSDGYPISGDMLRLMPAVSGR